MLGIDEPFAPGSADRVYDEMSARLREPAFRPRALYDRFGIELLATTDGSVDPLDAHARIRAADWPGRVVPTFRPDDTVDPERPGFHANVDRLADLTGEDTTTWAGYLAALRPRRAGSSPPAPRRPTTVTRRRARPTSPRPRRRRCSIECARSRSSPTTPSCSGPRCSPRWRP